MKELVPAGYMLYCLKAHYDYKPGPVINTCHRSKKFLQRLAQHRKAEKYQVVRVWVELPRR